MIREKENICFLVITYNAEKFLEKLFKSIKIEYEIFVVDNGSKDNTLKILEEKSIRFIKNGKNGYSAGVNKGLRLVKDFGYNLAFVLNQDTEIVEFNIDESLLEKYIIVQPMILNEDGTVGVDELKMNVYGFIFPHRYKKNVISESGELPFFSGAGFMINVSKYFQIGDFDENYFMYYEDIDYAVKCYLAGEKIFLTDKVKIKHYYENSVSSMKKMKRLLASRKIFLNKYLTDLWRLLLFIPDYKGNRNLIPPEEKEKFSRYIISKSVLGFNTRQVPFILRLFFNTVMYFYSLIIKLTVTSSLRQN